MQTKRKRKQLALLAFTLIATFMAQIITPLTVHAEEQTYVYNNFINGEWKEVQSSMLSDDYHIEYKYNCNITSNKPIKIGILEKSLPQTYYRDGFYQVYIFCEDITDISLTYFRNFTDLCEPCKSPDTHVDLMHTYSSRDFEVMYNSEGEVVGYYKRLFTNDQWLFDYYGGTDKDREHYCHANYNNSLISYFVNYEDYNGTCSISQEDISRFLKEVADGTIPPMNNGHFDESTAIYDETIPAPKMKVDNKLNYQFLNDDAGYMYQVKGRWRSIDNVTIENGTFSDKLFYKSTIQCDLLHWIAPTQEVSTIETSSLATIGKDYFYNFLTKYPIESRKIHFSNPSTNHENWYDVPKYKTYYDNFKDSLSSFNSVEVYVRYFKRNDDGTFSYGKWTHYYNNLTPSGSSDIGFRDGIGELETEHFQSENGLTNDEMNDLENLEDSRNDLDISGSGGSLGGVDSTIDFSKITQIVLSLFEQSKVLFSMFSTVFSFLPTWATELVAVSVVLVCFIGIWKVIR